MPSFKLALPVILAGVLATSGCVNHEARSYRLAGVKHQIDDLSVTSGSTTVLVTKNRVAWPWPDPSNTSRLYLEVNPSLIKPNAAITIPSQGVRALVWWSKANPHVSDTCSGSAFIDNVTPGKIVATINVRCRAGGTMWESRGSNIRFEDAPRATAP